MEFDLRKRGISSEDIRSLKLILGIKPGDLIAVKEIGSPISEQARLIIKGYAVAVEKDGQAYLADKKRNYKNSRISF